MTKHKNVRKLPPTSKAHPINASKSPANIYSEAQKMEMARKVNAYRKAHPRETVEEAINATGVDLKYGTYWAVRKRIEVLELEEKLAGQKKDEPINGHNKNKEETVFPLALIPPKPNGKTKSNAVVVSPVQRIMEPQASAADRATAAADLFDALGRLLRP